MSAVQVELVLPEVMFGANHRSRLTLALNRSLGEHNNSATTTTTTKKCRANLDNYRTKPFRTIDSSELVDRLCGPNSSQFLLLDCRSFVSYNSLHIRESVNLNCSDRISRRRLQHGKTNLEDLVNGRKGKDVLKMNSVREVIIYDDNTGDIDCSCCHPLLLVIGCLLENRKEPILLRGGLKQFQSNYPHLCESFSNSCSKVSSPSSLESPSLPMLITPSSLCNSSVATPTIYELDQYPATQVLPFLYLGNQRDAEDLQKLIDRNIGYVLNVTTHLPGYHEGQGIAYKRIPAADSGHQNLLQYFDEAVAFIDEAVSAGSSVLVHCQGGVSRSPTMTIAYLMYHSGLTLVDAYSFVKNERPVISPNLNFMGQLLEYERILADGKCATAIKHDDDDDQDVMCHTNS